MENALYYLNSEKSWWILYAHQRKDIEIETGITLNLCALPQQIVYKCLNFIFQLCCPSFIFSWNINLQPDNCIYLVKCQKKMIWNVKCKMRSICIKPDMFWYEDSSGEKAEVCPHRVCFLHVIAELGSAAEGSWWGLRRKSSFFTALAYNHECQHWFFTTP